MGSMFKWKVSSLTSRGSSSAKKADKLLNNNNNNSNTTPVASVQQDARPDQR